MWKVWTRILVFSLLNPNLCPRSSGTVNVFYDELLMNEDSDNKVSKREKKQVVNLDEMPSNQNEISAYLDIEDNRRMSWSDEQRSNILFGQQVCELFDILGLNDWKFNQIKRGVKRSLEATAGALSNRHVENKKQNEQVKHQLKPSRISVPSSWLSCQNQRIRESLRRSRTRANREEQHHQRSQWVKQRMSWGQEARTEQIETGAQQNCLHIQW